jgi:hypothetical protein
MKINHLHGLIAAPFTPLDNNNKVDVPKIDIYMENF